jgi:hypothetical protein
MSAQEPPVARTAERRASTRHSCNLTVLAATEPYVARVHNLSREGISFFIAHELNCPSLVTLELYNAVSCVWHLKGARVIHTTVQPDGNWLVGVAFLYNLTDADLQELLASPPIPSEIKATHGSR